MTHSAVPSSTSQSSLSPNRQGLQSYPYQDWSPDVSGQQSYYMRTLYGANQL